MTSLRAQLRRWWTWLLLAAIVATLAVCSAIQSEPEDLQTPFEKTNGAIWTTESESRQFWQQLAERSDRVEVERIGRSVEDRPILLVKVGEPSPARVGDAVNGSVLLYVCSVHGDEDSGREACMQLARDMATTDDPTWVRLLSRTTLLFVIGNPDGWAADTRGNADGVDINRDYLELATPEARAIVRVIRDWKPDVLNDLHEYRPRPYHEADLMYLWPRNRNVDNRIHRLARRMSQDYSAADVENEGYTTGVFGVLVKDGEPYLQVAGDGRARALRNYGGLAHVVGMLSETANQPLTPEEEVDPTLLNRRRVEVSYLSAVGSAEMILENHRLLLRQTSAAERRATQAGANQSGVVYFGGQDNRRPSSTYQVEPMCGYQLSPAQRDEFAPVMRLHGISWANNGEGAFVTMAQPDRPLIPLLFDERYRYALTAATPVDVC